MLISGPRLKGWRNPLSITIPLVSFGGVVVYCVNLSVFMRLFVRVCECLAGNLFL